MESVVISAKYAFNINRLQALKNIKKKKEKRERFKEFFKRQTSRTT